MEVTDPLYLAHIVESSNEAIIAVNLHNHVTYWNGAAERTFGYTRAEVLRRDVRDLICPHTARDHSTSSDQFATDGPNENPPAPTLSEDCECHVEDLAKKMTPYIARRRKKSGEPVDMLISVSPVYAPTMSLFSSSPAILLPPHLFAPHPITTPPTALPSPVGSDVLSVASELTSSSALSNNSSVTEGIVTGYATILTPIDYQGDQESLKFPIALPSHAFTFSSIEQSSSHLPQIMIDAIPPSPSVAFASAISVHTSQLTSAALSRLYERTFPLVGKEFLESLVSVLALMLDFDCVFVYEALSYEDWVESGGKDDVVNCAGDDPGASMTNSSPMNNGLSSLSVAASSSSLSLPSSSIAPDEVMLLARARWWPGMNDSDKGNESVLPCTILPLAGHPHEYTLSKQKHVVFKDLRSTYPFYQGYASYVGLRLDGPDGPVGVIGIMDARPMEMDRVVVVSELLDGVCQRVTAEMVRLRTEARLLKAKETAEQDADNKTKFLADMSHEIRTPMNAVIALTDLLLQDRMSLNDEQTEHLEVIQTSGQHLLTTSRKSITIRNLDWSLVTSTFGSV
ncbi:hypothetical protein BC936DRAFT_139453 [Jimgerdemannia flammicorona]|uniref:histidine kinase n=1 Tax=Jimgerdemannia flammicorona TaxID=994334 RepID=A0A433DHR6_9FUNG|nr:hypothetical protein BC936DRAFT_139453 [Jimgerdemannia flammicorona]